MFFVDVMIFVFFVVFVLLSFFVVVVFLCCYVVKLAQAKKEKVEVLPGIFNMTSYVCMCKSDCFCLVSLGCLALLFIQIGLFEDFEKLNFGFLGQN